jgi:hypothetical protein
VCCSVPTYQIVLPFTPVLRVTQLTTYSASQRIGIKSLHAVSFLITEDVIRKFSSRKSQDVYFVRPTLSFSKCFYLLHLAPTIGIQCIQYVLFIFCNHVSAEDRSLRLVHSVHFLYLNVTEIIESLRIWHSLAFLCPREILVQSFPYHQHRHLSCFLVMSYCFQCHIDSLSLFSFISPSFNLVVPLKGHPNFVHQPFGFYHA